MSNRGRSVGRGGGRSRGAGESSAGRLPARARSGTVRGEAGAGSRPRLIRDFFVGRGGRSIPPTHSEAVVDWVTQASSTQSSQQGPSSSGTSTTTTVPPAGPSPSPPPESPLMFEETEGTLGSVLGAALEEAQIILGPDGQDLMGEEQEGEEEEEGGEAAVFSPATPSPTASGGVRTSTPVSGQTQAAFEEHESRGEGSSPHVPSVSAFVQLGSDEGGDEEVGEVVFVPSAPSEGSSDDEAVRYRRPKTVRQVSGEPMGRAIPGPSSRISSSSRPRQQQPQPQQQQQQQQQQRPATEAARTQSPGRARKYTTQSGRTVTHLAPVWEHYTLSAEDHSIAICGLCKVRVSRGKEGKRLGTTAMNRHLKRYHCREWNRLQSGGGDSRSSSSSTAGQARSAPSVPLPPPPPPAPVRRRPIPSQLPSESEAGSSSQSSASASTSASTSRAARRQPSLPEVVQRTRALPPTDRRVIQWNGIMAEVLALTDVSYRFVEHPSFRKLIRSLNPQWQIPSRHFFSRTAVPALHDHIAQIVAQSLDHAVGGRVHLTMDAWTSRHGQGRYVAFTAHWVTLQGAVEGGRPGALQVVVPPRGVKGRLRPLTSATASTTSESAAAAEPPSKRPRCYSSVQHRRSQAVLQLVSLGDSRHTGPELLAALRAQVQKWLTPRRLQAGMVVADNGTNILSALRAGQLTHGPCFAHVLNLVVQKFLRTCPGLGDIVAKARRVATHFRRSATAAASLSKLQRDNGLPQHRLIVDCVTRWNSTLHMLGRMWEQRRAVREFLLEQDTRRPTQALPFITGEEWRQIQQVCRVLGPFQQATQHSSRENVGVNDVLPLVFLMDRTLCSLLEEGEGVLEEQARGGPLPGEQVQEQEEDEEDDDYEEPGPGHEGEGAPIVRGWGDSVEQQRRRQRQEEEEDRDVMGSQEEVAREHLFPMVAHMLRCLRRDPRVVAIKARDDYWVATLLDPRCKGQLVQFIPPAQQQVRMQELQRCLLRQLEEAFPQTRSPAVPAVHRQQVAGSSSASRAGDLFGELDRFFYPEQPIAATPSSSHHQRLARMVADYMGSLSLPDTMRGADPMDYWVARLETCSELAQYALEVLSCPPSSVMSERAFSAAGSVVTDRRTRLSTDSVDRLTFIKMNQSWIGEHFVPPTADSRD